MSTHPQPASLYDGPVLAHVVRGDFVESVHRGSVVALRPDGTSSLALGGVDDPVFPRSSNKPLQTVGMVRVGLDLPPDLLALASASHSGEPFHLEGTRRILAGAGLTEADLRNTPDLPYAEDQRAAWLRAGLGPVPVAQNCSGKHAAMLATCVVNGWPTDSYLDPEHPLQQHLATTIADLAGEPVAATAVDGCGAPVMAISLTGLARAFGAIASAAPDTDEGRVADAIRRHPEFLGGTGRDVTALIQGTAGLIAKDGAEAVYAAGLPDGRALALKIADGAQRARPVVFAAALRRMGVESEAYAVLEAAPVLGHGQPVGSVVAVGI